jgi:hypothetical protein
VILKRPLVAIAILVAALSVFVVSPALAVIATWSTPAADLSAAGENALAPQVTVDSNGLAIAVWSRSDGSNTIIQSSTSLNGAAWTGPVNLSAVGDDAGDPQVTVDANGLATAVWYRSNGAEWIIQSSTSLNGAAWVPAAADLSAAGGNAGSPQVTVDSNGLATAVWGRHDGANFVIQSSTSLNGAAWVPASADLSAAGENAALAQVTVAANGLATAVWQRSDGADYVIQSSTSLNGAAWVPASADLSAAGGTAWNPQITVDANGLATAVWYRVDGANSVIQSSTSLNGAAWVPASADLSVAGQNANRQQVTVDANGRATAVWWRYDGANTIVQSSTSLNGAAWTTPVDVSAAGGNAEFPQVAVDANGLATAVWFRSNGADWIIQSSTSLNGAAWTAPVNLSASGQTASYPQVVLDANGFATAVWQRNDGTTNVIQSSSTYPVAGPTLAATGADATATSFVVGAGVLLVLLGVVGVNASRRRARLQ